MHLISLKNNKWSYIGLLEYSVLMWLRFLQQVWNPFYPAGIVRTESASVRCWPDCRPWQLAHVHFCCPVGIVRSWNRMFTKLWKWTEFDIWKFLKCNILRWKPPLVSSTTWRVLLLQCCFEMENKISRSVSDTNSSYPILKFGRTLLFGCRRVLSNYQLLDGALGTNINKHIVLKDVFTYTFSSLCIYRTVNEIVHMKFYMYFIYYSIFVLNVSL